MNEMNARHLATLWVLILAACTRSRVLLAPQAIAPISVRVSDEANVLEYPGAPREAISETLHGVTVADPYRWLENADDPNVQRWLAEEETVARAARQDSGPPKRSRTA